jgi:hypothetical protein
MNVHGVEYCHLWIGNVDRGARRIKAFATAFDRDRFGGDLLNCVDVTCRAGHPYARGRDHDFLDFKRRSRLPSDARLNQKLALNFASGNDEPEPERDRQGQQLQTPIFNEYAAQPTLGGTGFTGNSVGFAKRHE